MANWIIIGLLLRISDNARRPQEEFHTGVLSFVADDLDKPEPEKPAAEAPSGAQRRPGAAPAAWEGSEALTEARPAVRGGAPAPADDAPTEAQLRELASSIDSAAEDLAANGPVPADELRRMLLDLEAEWGGDATSAPVRPDRRIARSTR